MLRVCLLVTLVTLAVGASPAQAAFPGTDGRIAYVWDADGDGLTEIHSIDPDGTARVRLTDSTANDRDPAWSPDGSTIAFTRRQPGTEFSDVFVMNADGSQQRNLTNRPGSYSADPAWSPGGNAIAFRDLAVNGGDIYRMNADGSGRVNLTNTDDVDESQPSWSPDGTRIAYTGASGNGTDVYVMNADGSGQTNLTNGGTYRSGAPSWSPNGTTIAFQTNRDGNDEIYLMDPDGGGQTNLTNDAARDSTPAWSPEGTAVLFHSDRDGQVALYVTGVHGTTRRAAASEAGSAPDWQPLAGPKGNVTVILGLTDSDAFRFDLVVGTQVVLAAAGDGGSATTTVDPGTHGLGPDPGPENSLLNYAGTTTCTKNGTPYLANAEPGAVIDVAAGDHIVCTIRLVRIGHTAVGTNVVVEPVDATTAGRPVRIEFRTVTFAGVTKLRTSSSGPSAPSGFAVAGTYYELSTTAAFDEAEVCFEIVPPSAPAIAHWTGDPPVLSTPATFYRDATGAVVPAGSGERACAVVTSFSPFALLVPESADSEPPVISCDEADGEWHAANVSIDCVAEDSASGLAEAADAAFSLTTAVPPGSEERDAQTGTREVCDRAGNCATAGPVGGNRVDRKAPTLVLPAGKTADATSPAGVTVSYAAAASDGADSHPRVSCAPPAGSVFAIGTTLVKCAATDHVGNTATGAFSVTVLGARQQLARLAEDVVTASRLPRQVRMQLLARLEPLLAGLDRNDPVQRRLVCSGLAAFRTVVGLLSGHAIPSAQATAWITDANRIRAVIGC